ncbi:MAG: hypothetical protein R2939_17170 [Kofleriaceae bacterium]
MDDHELFVWEPARGGGRCVLDRLPEDEHAMFRPRIGRAMGDAYPAARALPMSPDLGGTEVPDLVRNTLGFYVVSRRLRAVLEAEADAEFEMLPVEVLDRAGVAVPEPRWIANLLGRVVPCADLARSEMTELAMRPGRYTSIKRLYVDAAKVDRGLKIFRLGEAPKLWLVRADLRRALEASGATGMVFRAMGDDVLID